MCNSWMGELNRIKGLTSFAVFVMILQKKEWRSETTRRQKNFKNGTNNSGLLWNLLQKHCYIKQLTF